MWWPLNSVFWLLNSEFCVLRSVFLLVSMSDVPGTALPVGVLSAPFRVAGRWGLRLIGPILDKELRVASRRKSTYAVRAAYVMVLACVVCRIGFDVLRVQSYGTAASSGLPDMAA